jgi:hypothetical protein
MLLNQLANGLALRRRAVACAALAGAMIWMTAGTASAVPFTTCSGGVADAVFPGAAFRCESETRTYGTGLDVGHIYFFDGGDFTNTLTFDQVLHDDLIITMTAFWVLPGNPVFLSRVPTGYIPEIFETTSGPSWIYFRVENLTETSGPPQEGIGNDYLGDWHQEIAWFGDGEYVNPQVFHDSRPLDFFGANITDAGSFCVECGPPGDPAIGGTARDFSDTLVADTTVPEPASFLLIGSGLGALYRRRQRALAARDSA